MSYKRQEQQNLHTLITRTKAKLEQNRAHFVKEEQKYKDQIANKKNQANVVHKEISTKRELIKKMTNELSQLEIELDLMTQQIIALQNKQEKACKADDHETLLLKEQIRSLEFKLSQIVAEGLTFGVDQGLYTLYAYSQLIQKLSHQIFICIVAFGAPKNPLRGIVFKIF